MGDPAWVVSPATSQRSLIETGMPASGDGTTPAARKLSLASAAAIAPSANTRMNARGPSPLGSSIRANASSVSARLVVLPVSRSFAISAIGRIGQFPHIPMR